MLRTETHRDALGHWPPAGRHILAQFDADSIVVYQAYNEEIAAAAVADGRLGGGGFSLNRMSWIKPNFLWMMYRSGWATKPHQERLLAIRIPRARFVDLLDAAVHSSFSASTVEDEPTWRAAVATSDVRLQWDPDHAPDGTPQARRAVQLGLRGEILRRFAVEWPIEILDVTAFVREQRAHIGTPTLLVPTERVFALPQETARRIGLDRQ
ncbi:hypothetical protein LBMAG42_35110 [Deltaproteobacteria bacterium]|nr:hypothetical protein LBMAG42_35110 [Deltaproteobacteria bacterium]